MSARVYLCVVCLLYESAFATFLPRRLCLNKIHIFPETAITLTKDGTKILLRRLESHKKYEHITKLKVTTVFAPVESARVPVKSLR